MKQPKIPGQSGFSITTILGLLFVFIGVMLFVSLLGKLPQNMSNITQPLEWGAAAGSLLGGVSMLFKKNQKPAQIRLQ
ncbi:hypothetical protein J4212_00695 [Candidatus Woesearchaeota archaeon]|nr:hypothetical protein [Candidatus Woesearchaeota archaeon]